VKDVQGVLRYSRTATTTDASPGNEMLANMAVSKNVIAPSSRPGHYLYGVRSVDMNVRISGSIMSPSSSKKKWFASGNLMVLLLGKTC
jgi:hypothetical protein